MRWGTGYDTVEHSFVNIVATPKGGTHVQGFERGLLRAFLNGLDGTRLLKAGEDIVKDDVLEEMFSGFSMANVLTAFAHKRI